MRREEALERATRKKDERMIFLSTHSESKEGSKSSGYGG